MFRSAPETWWGAREGTPRAGPSAADAQQAAVAEHAVGHEDRPVARDGHAARLRELAPDELAIPVVAADLEEDRQNEIVARTRGLVEKGGGSWDLHDVWGRRRLAYEIGHKGEGSYHLLQLTCDAATLDEISRVLRIDDGVMRHMATRRIEGSPARPVAVGAPAREDAEIATEVEEEEE